jgi:hypothetical protein
MKTLLIATCMCCAMMCGTVAFGKDKKPTCTLSASPKKIPLGAASTLTIQGKDAVSATIDGTTVAVSEGTKSVKPAKTTIFQGKVHGSGVLEGTCKTTVVVAPK